MKYDNIGDYLNYEFIEKYKINQRVIAKLIKVHNNRINEIIRGKRSVTIDTDLRLCKLFKLEDGHFFNLQNEIEYQKTKREMVETLSQISAVDNLFKKQN